MRILSFLVLVVFLGLIFISGCIPRVKKEKVLVPPEVDISQFETIILGKFRGEDEGVLIEARMMLAERFKQQNQQIIDKSDFDEASIPWKEEKALLVLGDLTYYSVDTYASPPKKSTYKEKEQVKYSWYCDHSITVTVNFVFRLMDATTGKLIYFKQFPATETWHDYYVLIDWHQETPPPSSLIPPVNTSNVFTLRTTAIKKAVNDFCNKIIPHYEWR